MPTDWLDRIKQTMAVDIGRFQTAGLPPKAIVEKLMEIPELCQALQMRADRRKASLWLPINSAPKKDGFLAIVYCPDNSKEERVMMGEYSRSRGWSIHIDAQLIEPTHWQPLPDPPIS